MAANQRNYQVFSYVDNGGFVWNKRGVLDAAINAIDGSTTLTPGQPVWPKESTRFHTRKAVFYDPTTFRTVRFTVYTAAAFASIKATPPTLNINVPGNTGAVAYTLAELIDEKAPVAKATRQLPDHA